MRLELRTREDVHARCDDDPAPFGVLHPVAVSVSEPLADLHPEDAFLAELAAFLRRDRALGTREQACGVEIARDALDLVDGLDGDFGALPVRRWQAAALATAARGGLGVEAATRLVQEIVAFLCAQGRLDAASARRIRRTLRGGRPRRALRAERAAAPVLACAA